MSDRLDMSDPFERSVAVEVLLESIGHEIGYYNWLADQVGEDTPDGVACLQAATEYARVRQNLNPSDDNQLAIVQRMLRATFTGRQVLTHQIERAAR